MIIEHTTFRRPLVSVCPYPHRVSVYRAAGKFYREGYIQEFSIFRPPGPARRSHLKKMDGGGTVGWVSAERHCESSTARDIASC